MTPRRLRCDFKFPINLPLPPHKCRDNTNSMEMTSQRQIGMLGGQSIGVGAQGQAHLESTSVWQRTLQGRISQGNRDRPEKMTQDFTQCLTHNKCSVNISSLTERDHSPGLFVGTRTSLVILESMYRVLPWSLGTWGLW